MLLVGSFLFFLKQKVWLTLTTTKEGAEEFEESQLFVSRKRRKGMLASRTAQRAAAHKNTKLLFQESKVFVSEEKKNTKQKVV